MEKISNPLPYNNTDVAPSQTHVCERNRRLNALKYFLHLRVGTFWVTRSNHYNHITISSETKSEIYSLIRCGL